MGLSLFLELKRILEAQTWILTIIVFFFSVYFLLKWLGIKVARSEKLNLPPSPPGLPLIGNTHQINPLIHQSFLELSKKYGPIMLIQLAQTPILVVSSPDMATEILKTHDLVFANRFVPIASRTIFYGGKDIVLAPYGEYWRKVRKICVLELLSIKRIQSFKYVREEVVEEMIEKLNFAAIGNETVDLSQILFGLSFDIISRCSLGDKFKEEYTNRFADLMKKANSLVEGFTFGDFYPCLRWIDVLTGFTGKLKRTFQELDNFFDEVIDDHLSSKSNEVDDKKSFLNLLLNYTDEKDNLRLDRDSIKGIILDMFIGGSDTSATNIEWAMAELIKNPKVMKKAQEEIRKVVGNKSKVEEGDIIQMTYLKHIVKESLRLHPPLPTLIARKSKTVEKIGGYDIPPNSAIFVNVWAIQRDPKLWENPLEFYPERFINNSIDFQGKDFEFIPFGSGRRGCPGMSFGLAVVELVLANLLYWFDWKLPLGINYEELDMTEGFGMTVNRHIPLHVVPVNV